MSAEQKQTLTSRVVDNLQNMLQSQGMLVTSIDKVYNWGHSNSVRPMFATSCSGIDMVTVGTAKFDIARFGSEVARSLSNIHCGVQAAAYDVETLKQEGKLELLQSSSKCRQERKIS